MPAILSITYVLWENTLTPVFKRLLSAAFAVPLAISLNLAAAEAAVVDPDTGGNFDFEWSDGLGPVDFINGDPGGTFSISVLIDSFIELAVKDCCNPGDAFGVVLNGASVAWDNAGFDGSGFFSGMVRLFLPSGTNLVGIEVTALAPIAGTPDFEQQGLGFVTFGAAVPAGPKPPAVPLPASSLLLLGGLSGMALLARRRQKG